jgi:hypothetical protein
MESTTWSVASSGIRVPERKLFPFHWVKFTIAPMMAGDAMLPCLHDEIRRSSMSGLEKRNEEDHDPLCADCAHAKRGM